VIEGRSYVIPDDVKMVAPYVLAHRLVLRQEAILDGVTQKTIVNQIVQSMKVP
jgi:MoxR-like ATPase